MDDQGQRRRAAWRWGASVVALALVGAAIVAVSRAGVDFPRVRELIAGGPRDLLVASVTLPLANLAISSLVFWVLTRRFGKVGYGEMCALIGAAWLLNYLPLRPGLVGRVAYHRAINGIPVAKSARVVLESITCSAIASAAAVLWSALRARRPEWEAALSLAPIVWIGGFTLAGAALMSKRAAIGAPLVALGLRGADLLVWTLRYWAVFSLADSPVSMAQAAAIAAVSQVAMSIPFAGNGLGLREWAVGLLRAALPLWYGASAASAVGLTADLLNRSAEIVAAVPVGLLCAWAVARRMRSATVRQTPGVGEQNAE